MVNYSYTAFPSYDAVYRKVCLKAWLWSTYVLNENMDKMMQCNIETIVKSPNLISVCR